MYQQRSLEERRAAASRNAARMYQAGNLTSGLFVRELDKPKSRPKPEPYVPMHQRPEVVKLGRQYDEALKANDELNRCLKRLDVIEKQKYPSEARLQEKKELWAFAEEWQAAVDAFWVKHPEKFAGHPELVAARRAWQKSLKEA